MSWAARPWRTCGGSASTTCTPSCCARAARTRISDVATRWGFFHPSRFARQYQERFGELPSDTIRRGAP
jgi:AraC-like DNA-binding protein